MAARILVCFRQMFCIHLVKIPVKEPLHLVAGVFNSEKVEVLFFDNFRVSWHEKIVGGSNLTSMSWVSSWG
jgi:hypothetical protein